MKPAFKDFDQVRTRASRSACAGSSLRQLNVAQHPKNESTINLEFSRSCDCRLQSHVGKTADSPRPDLS